MAEDGPENANVVAATVAQPHQGLLVPLVSNTQTGSEGRKAGACIASQVHTVLARNTNLARGWVNPTALTSATHPFRPVNFPPEPKIDRQLVVAPPSFLTTDQQTLLSLPTHGA